MKKISSVLFSVCISFFCTAQNIDSLKSELPEVIITATRTIKNTDEIPRSISVISKSDAEQLQSIDFAQLLSQQEGISIIGSGQNPGMTETIFMRGTNSNHTLIMIDGVRISDPSTVNSALDLTEIPASGFEQIEIVRGSHSTMYGSSGIGGVINLISSGLENEGLHGNVAVKGGVFGNSASLLEEKIHFNYSFKKGFYTNLDFYNTNTNGLDATVDTITNTSAFKSYDHDNFNLLKAGAKVGFENKSWNVFAAFSHTNQQTDFDKAGWKYNVPYGENPLAYYDGDNSGIHTNRNLFSYNLEHSFSKVLSLQLNGGYTNLKRDVIDDSSIVNISGGYDHTYNHALYEGSNMNHDLQLTANLKNIILISGVGLLRETMTYDYNYFTNGYFGPFEININLDSLNLYSNIYHFFAQAEVSGKFVSEKLKAFNLIAGARYNQHNLFGGQLDYEINPSVAVFKDALLYASFSTGFNAPSLYQLYSPEGYYTSDITRGNPDLKPEVSQSFEIGFKQKINSHFKYSIALYSNKIENEIEYVYLWDKNIPVEELATDFYRDDFRGDTYLNVGTLNSNGIEISFSADINKYFEAGGNINLLKGNLTYDPANVDTNHTEGNHIQLYSNGAFLNAPVTSDGLTRRPSSANFFFTCKPITRLQLQLFARWIGEHSDIYYDTNLLPYGALNTIALSSYTLFDFNSSFSFNKHIAANLRIENIFNTDYTETRGFTSRGRGIFLSVRVSL